jgi:hypothetical protein
MRALIVYESMYGNTHQVAQQIGEGLRGPYTVSVLPVANAMPAMIAEADLVVVGGPTHAHGMTSSFSRKEAIDAGGQPDSGLTVDPDAAGTGLRDWFKELPSRPHAKAAAFDTRVDAPAALTGRSSKGIARRLRRLGFDLVTEPASFLVDKENRLLPGEYERAEEWGAHLASIGAEAGVRPPVDK